MIDLSTRRPREVARAARAFAAQADPDDPFGHRKLTAEAKAGNPYVLKKLARRGLVFDRYGIHAAPQRTVL